MKPLLLLDKVTVQFGGLKAVSDVTFQVGERELFGLIGPNGAGKTTVFNAITGVYRPTEGRITFDGQSVAGKKPYAITARGIARTFQNIRLFGSMSVYDNVRCACNMHLNHGISHALWRGKRVADEEEDINSTVMELLGIFGLTAQRDWPPPRNRPCARHAAKASAARRTRRRHEPDGEDRADEADPFRAGKIRPRGAARGARHEGRDGYLRAHRSARLRTENRRRHACGDSEKSQGDRGLSWTGGGTCLN
jgi:hypothetical protein